MKRLFLIRGVSGSGKSTLAKAIAPDHNVASDDFFTDPVTGEYKWEGNKVVHAHTWCKNVAAGWMAQGVPMIAVHNTFTELWQLEPYKVMAELWGYQVFILIADGDYVDVHSVPTEALERQVKGFQHNNRYLRGE